MPIKQRWNMNIYEFNQKAELYLEQVTEPLCSRDVFSAEALIWGWQSCAEQASCGGAIGKRT